MTVQDEREAIKLAFHSPEVIEVINKTAKRMLEEKLDPEVLALSFEEKMEDCWKELAFKMLGVSNKWGRWEVDRCNGRHSAISEMLSARAQEAVDTFIDKAGTVLPSIEIEDDMIKSLVEDYYLEVNRQLNRYMDRKVEQDVDKFISEQFEKAIKVHTTPSIEAANTVRIAMESITDKKALKVLERAVKELETQGIKGLNQDEE